LPNRAPIKRDSHPQSLPFISYRFPDKGAPLQAPLNGAPIERDAPSSEPRFNYLSEFPWNGHIHPLSPPPSVLLDYQKGAPKQSSHKERCSLSGALHLSVSLVKEPSPRPPPWSLLRVQYPILRAPSSSSQRPR